MLESFVSGLATCLTLGMFSTGIHTVQKIKRKGTGETPLLPFATQATATFLWLNYGIMKGDGALILVNTLGFLLNCLYILLFYWYTPNKSSVYKTVSFFLISLFLVHMYSVWQHTHPQEAIDFLGFVAMVVTVGMFAAPLGQLSHVVRTRCTDSMSFPLAFMMLAQSLAWWWYGVIKDDFYIQFPNGCGSLLGLVQLGIFGLYWSKEPETLSSIMENL